MDELCIVTRSSPRCDHSNCLAKVLLLTYVNLKQVIVMNGEERTTGSVTLAERDTTRFTVTKINSWGRKQLRILAVDAMNREMHSFDRQMNLKRVIPLSQLIQVEKSLMDSERLNLVFAEGAAPNYLLLFESNTQREEFVRCVVRVVNDDKRSSMVSSRAGSVYRRPSIFAGLYTQPQQATSQGSGALTAADLSALKSLLQSDAVSPGARDRLSGSSNALDTKLRSLESKQAEFLDCVVAMQGQLDTMQHTLDSVDNALRDRLKSSVWLEQ